MKGGHEFDIVPRTGNFGKFAEHNIVNKLPQKIFLNNQKAQAVIRHFKHQDVKMSGFELENLVLKAQRKTKGAEVIGLIDAVNKLI